MAEVAVGNGFSVLLCASLLVRVSQSGGLDTIFAFRASPGKKRKKNGICRVRVRWMRLLLPGWGIQNFRRLVFMVLTAKTNDENDRGVMFAIHAGGGRAGESTEESGLRRIQ